MSAFSPPSDVGVLPIYASAPLSLIGSSRSFPRSTGSGQSAAVRASLSGASLATPSSAVYPYPHSPPLHDAQAASHSAQPAHSTIATRHQRHHSTGSSSFSTSSSSSSSASSPARRTAYSSTDEESFGRSVGSGSNGNVALQIRSRGSESRGNSVHGRHSSDEDARGLKKGRKGWLWRLLPAALLALAGMLFLLWFGWAWWVKDGRSSDVTVLLPHLALSSTRGEQVTAAAAAADQLVYAAFASWLHVLKPSTIIVYMDSDADCAALSALFPGVQCFHLPTCTSSAAPPFPELWCVVSHALGTEDVASTLVLMSRPLAFDRRLLDAAKYVSANQPADKPSGRWLMAGARIDVSLTGMAAREWASEGFAGRLFSEGAARGVPRAEHAMDALVVSRSLLSEMLQKEEERLPPFVAGGGHWTKLLFVQAMLDDAVTVLDMSFTVALLHLQFVGAARTEEDAAVASPLQSLRSDADHDGGGGATGTASTALARNQAVMQERLGVKVALGRLTYAPYILEGDCPDACVISPNPDTRWQAALLFTQRVNGDGYLAVLTVNSGYLALAKNWLCWAERIGFTHFILLAEDNFSAEALRSPAVPVIVRPHASYKKEAADYGSVEFQETMSYRTEFLLDVLTVGYHFLTADMDAIWLSDPLPHLDRGADLSGQTHKKVKLSGGLVVVRATEAGRAFWKDVIRCQRNNAKFLAEHAVGTYEPSLYTEQYCINQLYLTQPPPPAFTRTLLDPWLFPDGLSFFEQQQPQHAGVVPVIVHNNWIRGSEAKLRRMREWGLTSTDDSNTVCAPIPSPPLPAIAPKALTEVGFSLIIRVLTRSSPADLSALLESLSALQCAGCGEVTLQIDVDRLPEVEDMVIEQTVARHATYQQLLELAQRFDWTQGKKVVREGKRRRGRMGQWLDGWPTVVDPRVLYLLLDEQAHVSTELYAWLTRAVQRYYLGEDVDARLVGLQLEREELILSETYWSRWPDRRTSQLLPSNATLYRYQSLSPHAQLMFPGALQRFAAWTEERSVDHATSLPPATTNNHLTPCIPLMVSNGWYLPQGDVQQELHYETEDVWWVWMMRWMYEEGLYSLVTHFPRGQALVSHPAGKAGMFLNATQRAPLLAPAASASLPFPPLSSLPLYSFAFAPISPPSLLSVLPALSPSTLSVQCYSAATYEDEQRERQDAEERKRQEDELRARAAAESKAKKSISDAMKREKRKAEHSKAKREEEDEAKKPFAVELEGG